MGACSRSSLLLLASWVLLPLCCGVGAMEEFEEQSEGSKAGSNSTWICHFKQIKDSGWVISPGEVSNHKCDAPPCAKSADHQEYLGYIGAIIAVLFFGSNFVPVKKFESGDGMFFQWVLCVGIWLVGLVVNFALDSPFFFLPAVIGGFMWTTGNLLVVPVIKMIGLTMGLTVWGVTNMLSGWAQGRFIFGQHVTCSGLNFGGVATVVISVIILAFVKSDGAVKAPPNEENRNQVSETSALLGDRTDSLEGSLGERVVSGRVAGSPTSINSNKITFSSKSASSDVEPEETSWIDKLGVWHKRIAGFVLSLIAGLFFSFLFLPVGFLKLCNDTLHSCSDMDYLFGVYSGILFTSTFYFFIYSAINRNKPKIYPRVIFPGIISGLMWGIAMAGWFLANQHLSMAISFPLVTAGPGFVSSVWGILVYREITGVKNIALFFVAFAVSLTGLVMSGLSRSTIHCGHQNHFNCTTTS